MTLLLPFVLVGPVMLVAAAVAWLASHGPLGWLAAAAFLTALFLLGRAAVRRTWAWWVSTKVPERPPTPARARPHAGSRRMPRG